jgi:hypothetical protein
MTTIGRRGVAGDQRHRFDAMSTASISGHSIPRGLALPAADHGVVPGGAERAEQRHTGFIEPSLLPVNCRPQR